MSTLRLEGLAPPPGPVRAVLDVLGAAGHAAWLVGGCVRDRLLGRPVNDWDVTTDAPPEAVMACFERTVPTGIDHGTVTVVEQGEAIEVTTFRVDLGYTDGRRPDGVRFTADLQEDLARRDFTVNAMAWDPRSHRLSDPFGGQADLSRRSIRAVGDAVDRFSEDGLRALRAIRFAAVLDFGIHPATWAAIPATVETFRQISAERIRVELDKTLLSQRAGWGMGALVSTALAGVFLPEVAALAPSDLAEVVGSLDRAPARISVRLAALLHAAPGSPEPALRRLRYANAVRKRVAALLALRDEAPEAARDDAAVRALVARVGSEALDDWLAYRRAQAPEAWNTLAARIDALGAREGPLRPTDLSLSGAEVMARAGLAPSRRVGEVLRWLLQRVWEDPSLDTKEGLTALLPAALRATE